jgi:hypothetical protein
MRILTPLFALCLAIVLCACSQKAEDETAASPNAPALVAESRESPTQVVEAFMKAQSTGDETVLNTLLTAKAREAMESDAAGGFSDNPLDSYTIGAETITGDQASVDVQAMDDGEPQNAAMKLRLEDGAWRVWGIAMKLGPDSEFTMDMEKMGEMVEGLVEGLAEGLAEGIQQSMGNWQQGGSDEEIAAVAAMFDALVPVSLEEYEASWKSNDDFRGKPRGEALAALATPLKLAVYPGEFTDALAENVATDTRGLGRLEAIDRIAGEAGLRAIFPDPTDYSVLQSFAEGLGDALVGLITGDNAAISVQGAEAEALVAEAKAQFEEFKAIPKNAIQFEASDASSARFAGPFRVEVAALQENPPHATGDLSIVAAAHGVPPAILSASQDGEYGLNVEAVEDAKGRPLVDPNIMFSSGGQSAGGIFYDVAQRELRNLLRDVEVVQRVPTKVSLARPVEVIEFDFDSIKPEASQQQGDYRVTVKEVGENVRFEITGPAGNEDAIAARMQPYKADGTPLGIVFSFVNGWNGVTTAELSSAEAPARVRLKLIPKMERHEYALDLGPIPLHHFAEMPEKLVELSFEGHAAPITLELVQIIDKEGDFRKVTLRVTNHSNKAPTSAMVDFIYRGANGDEIDSFPHTVNGNFDSDGWQPIAAPGATAELEQTTFQMPADATAIDFVVNRIEFVDGTVWEPAN